MFSRNLIWKCSSPSNEYRIMNFVMFDCVKKHISSTVIHGKDSIGPPNRISNLRPIKFHIPVNESPIERQFRLEREYVQKWNEEFWVEHNSAFMKECEEFRQNKLEAFPNQKSLSAEEMSDFYKAFLDKNWKTHALYNFQWYTKNFHLVFLALKVKLDSFSNTYIK